MRFQQNTWFKPTPRILAALAFVFAMAVLPACNTVEGAGEDIEGAGEGIADVSRDVRD